MNKVVVHVAWYRRDEWPLLKALAADSDKLENTYDEWVSVADKTLRQLKSIGVEPAKVDVGVNELAQWCQRHGRVLDGGARAEFVREKPAPPSC